MIMNKDSILPIGGMGGSIHAWERGVDPWHVDAFPQEFQHRVGTRGPRQQGWYALDAWHNVIGFVADGTQWPPEDNKRNKQQEHGL
jgi:hypothetical protein